MSRNFLIPVEYVKGQSCPRKRGGFTYLKTHKEINNDCLVGLRSEHDGFGFGFGFGFGYSRWVGGLRAAKAKRISAPEDTRFSVRISHEMAHS